MDTAHATSFYLSLLPYFFTSSLDHFFTICPLFTVHCTLHYSLLSSLPL
jgi:hypothetical protein